ncbi:MAG TPA: VOC family protein [Phycisphaerae bacterium]|nr:VOC family protein [Phycisphaerae bacterium]
MVEFAEALDHVAIAADDTQAMAQWYNRMLGLVILAQSEPQSPSKQRTYLIGPPKNKDVYGAMMMEIMPRNEHVRRPRDSHDAGISHVAWLVNNFDEMYSHLASQGVGFIGSVVQAIGGGRVISFVDCEGNLMQIVERKGIA